jgi:2-polyprenyl-3-methyl-5-hydroxy-6-metoxy-1,4-benzoquinol methylase
MTRDPEQIRRSWVANASAWRSAVRERKIESRRIATDAAIVRSVLDQNPRRVLDLGCCEGWLSRELAGHGIDVIGFDTSPALIEAAQDLGGGDFRVLSYESLIASPTVLEPGFDVIAANFSLFEEQLAPLLTALRVLLAPEGALVVQTVHPAFIDLPYQDGWQTETFATIGGDWQDAMPWYFRTLASWVRLFTESGYLISGIVEPLHPEHLKPLSIIFVCRAGG